MSSPTYTVPPVWQPNPYTLDPTQILAAMQNNALASNIYDSTSKTIGTINETQRLLTAELSAVNKNIFDTIGQNSVSIERTAANGASTTERNANQINSNIERNANQINSAVERNTGNIMTAIEKVAGEGRLTTTITDAASRQAANDSARDILRSLDRIGSETVGSTKDAYNGLLSSIERNSGENRVQTLTSSGHLQQGLTDVRHTILNDVNRGLNEVQASNTQNLNSIIKSVTDGNWEVRESISNNQQQTNNMVTSSKYDLAQQNSQYYASLLLEDQKNKEYLARNQDQNFAALMSKTDNQFAALISKTDNHYSSLLLEQQKSKELLATQAAQQFAISQLEQQKIKESITLQLQDAKYEALKNKQELSKELAECCCNIKEKVDQRTQDVISTVDTLDRNRLRDEVNTVNNENSLLKFMEYGPFGYGYGDYGNHHHHHHHRRGRRGRGRGDSDDER